jgi:hypothetical protein
LIYSEKKISTNIGRMGNLNKNPGNPNENMGKPNKRTIN